MSSCYRLIMPNGKKKNIYYNSSDNKIDLINEQVLKYWDDYLETHFIWQNKFEQGRLNFEDKTKSLLDRCATFLMLGEFDRCGMLNRDKIKRIYQNELPLSCTADSVQDKIYSINPEGDEMTYPSDKGNEIIGNEIIMGNIDPEDKIKIHKKKFEKIKKKYINSNQYKMKNIYTIPDCVKYEYIKIKNGDLAERPVNKELSEGELKKWKEKNFKNVFGENLYTYKQKIYKGREGMINPEEFYIVKWCYVDSTNIFNFNGKKYRILNDVKQYKIDSDNQCQMDTILCFNQNNILLFFDQNIDRVDNSYILEID